MIFLLRSENSLASLAANFTSATNSLSMVFTPKKKLPICAYAHGIPMHQAIGEKIQPAILSRERASPATTGSVPRP